MVFVIILGCLFPLAIYCLVIASLNRGRHPVLVSGAWDFAGVLFAASGFLLLVGPYALLTFQQRWRERALYDLASGVARRWEWGWSAQVATWAGYFLVLVFGSVWLLRRRRRVTSIYNIEPDAVPRLLNAALERVGLSCEWTGDRAILRPRPVAVDAADSGAGETNGPVFSKSPPPPAPVLPPLPAGAPALWVRLEAFPRMRHATLHWPSSADPWRRWLERELVRVLEHVPVHPNPAAQWFLTIAASLLTMMVAILLGLILFIVLIRLRFSW